MARSLQPSYECNRDKILAHYYKRDSTLLHFRLHLKSRQGGHKRLSPQFGGGNTPRRGKNRTMSNEEALYEHSSLHRHIHHFIRHGNNSVPVLSVPCRGGFVFQPLCNHLANQLMVWPFWPFRASGRSALPLWSQAVHRPRTCLLKPFCTSKVC